MTVEKRFWEKVDKRGLDECWDWQASLINDYGHGQAYDGENVVSAHRLAYRLEYGEPDGIVQHKCDNPSCVNPKHLKDGTQKENMEHASETGRIAHGEEAGPSKLKRKDVVEIRTKLEVCDLTQAEIANQYEVSQSVISDISTGKSWSE